MGRHKAKTGGSGKNITFKGKTGSKSVPSREEESPEDDEGFGSESFVRLNGKKNVDSEDEEDEEVFDLAGSDFDDSDDDENEERDEDEDKESNDEDDDDDDDNDDDDDDDDDDEGDDDDDDPNSLRALVDSLPASLRQRVLAGGVDQEDESDDDSEGNKHSSSGWGSRKMYHGGDTADLEIGQDRQDAFDEEDAALELHNQAMSSMKEDDFYEDLQDESESDGENDEFYSKKSSGRSGGVLGTLEGIVLRGDQDILVEHLHKDSSKLTKAQRLKLLASGAPEVLPLVEELKGVLGEIEQLDGAWSNVVLQSGGMHQKLYRGQNRGTSNAAIGQTERVALFKSYLEAKRLLLFCYATNIMYFLTLRSGGGATHRHPVMRQLLEIKYGLQKYHRLDQLYAGDIDKWSANEMIVDEEEEEEAEEADENEDEDSNEMEDEDDYHQNPDSDQEAALAEDDAEYSRPVTSKPGSFARNAQTKKRKAGVPLACAGDFGDFTDRSDALSTAKQSGGSGDAMTKLTDALKALAKKQKSAQSEKKSSKEKGASRKGITDDALDEVLDKRSKRKNPAPVDDSDDDDDDDDGGDENEDEDEDRDGFKALLGLGSGRIRRPAPMDDDDSFSAPISKKSKSSHKANPVPEDDLVERFGAAKKAFLTAKKDHYQPAPRYGGLQEVLDTGSKRAATYEMIKNKGLTPHRKKANRNPRVKKREMYNKAVVARKGQVREVVKVAEAGYGGELTGIKANLARSRKIAT